MKLKSKKAGKQRKAVYDAPMHKRQKLVAAHLSKVLIKQYGTRSLPLRKGDEVKIMRGDNKGFTGKIEKINLKRLKIYIENLKRKKVSGSEAKIPVQPSNLLIIAPVMDDKKRQKMLKRKGKKGEMIG